MRWPVHALSLACAVALCTAAEPVRAQEKPSATRFSAELGIGGEYDSNVAVDELDASSNQADYALTLDGELKVDHEINTATNLSLTYDFSQTNYDEFSQLDRQTHLVGADLSGNLGKVTSGVTFYYINARLDGEDFLEYYRGSPYLSGFLAKKWFARGAYVYSDKGIEQNPGRDATSHSGEFDLYYFNRGLRSYFNIGYKFKREDATADRYDLVSNDIKLRYIHRWDVFGKPLKTELSWRYEYRDYSSVTPSIGEERWDRRHRWKLDVEYPVLSQGAIEFYSGYADYASNYPTADYTQYVVGTRFSWRW